MILRDIDLTHQRFGRLVVLWRTGEEDRRHDYKWLCECDCGNITRVGYYNLLYNYVKSCGCLKMEMAIEQAKRMGKMTIHSCTHGDSPHGKRRRTLEIWKNMNRRCFDLKSSSYKYYGKRGITVCDEWKNNYLAFKEWALSSGYKNNLTIDRINSRGNYEPNNCQWLTRSENTKKQWIERKA